MEGGKPFTFQLERWMGELDVNDGQLAAAYLTDDGYGLLGSTTKRVGEWRRGQSTPQNIARVRRLEAALRTMADAKGIPLPEDLLTSSWHAQRSERSSTVRPMHTNARTALERGAEGDAVRLTGVVSGKPRGRGGISFFDVLDSVSLKVLQFGAQRDELTPEDFSIIKSLGDGTRIQVEGRLANNNRGDLIAWVSQPPVIHEQVGTLSLATAAPEQRRVMAGLLAASVRHAVEAHFLRSGFLGVSCRVLSSSHGPTDGLNPLVAFYPGFGTPVSMAPSPSPQLVDAIIMTGANRVFSSTACFTTSYRDDLDGVETDLLMGKIAGADLLELLQLAEEVLKVVGDEVGLQLPEGILPRHTVNWPELNCDPTELPEVVISKIPSNTGDDALTTVFRVHLSDTCVPIEGSLEPFTSQSKLGTLSIFPGRFLPLVAHTPIRRLYPLGMGTDVSGPI